MMARILEAQYSLHCIIFPGAEGEDSSVIDLELVVPLGIS
jgi:hypothetical protein